MANLAKNGFPRRIAHHDLFRLLGEARVELSPTERELIARVKESVQWRGRYSVPIDLGDMLNEFNAATDVRQINVFLSRLVTHVGADSVE